MQAGGAGRQKTQSTVAAGDIGAFSAVTPPLDGLRLVCSLVMRLEVKHDFV